MVSQGWSVGGQVGVVERWRVGLWQRMLGRAWVGWAQYKHDGAALEIDTGGLGGGWVASGWKRAGWLVGEHACMIKHTLVHCLVACTPMRP